MVASAAFCVAVVAATPMMTLFSTCASLYQLW